MIVQATNQEVPELSTLLAVSAMKPGVQAVFFFAFFLLCLVAGILAHIAKSVVTELMAFGLAAFAFVLFWNQLAAA